MQAISFVIDGHLKSRGEVAEFAGVGRQTLLDWVKQYNEHDPEAAVLNAAESHWHPAGANRMVSRGESELPHGGEIGARHQVGSSETGATYDS